MADQTKIVFLEEMDGLERIDQGIRTLMTTAEATVPGSRGFGMPIDVIDLSPEEFEDEFAIALNEKMEEYIPEARIAGLEMGCGPGARIPMEVRIEQNDEYGEAESE